MPGGNVIRGESFDKRTTRGPIGTANKPATQTLISATDRSAPKSSALTGSVRGIGVAGGREPRVGIVWPREGSPCELVSGLKLSLVVALLF